MPHCVIEHSDNLDADSLVEQVFKAALASALFEPDGSDIKVRAQGFKSYLTGPAKADFIHVTVKILSGRTAEQKSTLADVIIAGLAKSGYAGVSMTVDVVDMDRASYRKVI
ncbi:5-carboxymethyl-2-hydroxymuconate Delta-isomerase [Oceanobacter mangrovi]|uniref:5-carboxymethyl-2-hydroxymuconate Delta-isomerase n=1 Tax=Oceanobacter mangrovi TaxID=2862510 RepID=UPI001C8DD432|nr:5-carboxymethyl-2-hydroxymuconate Delta-isomerase [Oceanobacter mangrovi]